MILHVLNLCMMVIGYLLIGVALPFLIKALWWNAHLHATEMLSELRWRWRVDDPVVWWFWPLLPWILLRHTLTDWPIGYDARIHYHDEDTGLRMTWYQPTHIFSLGRYSWRQP